MSNNKESAVPPEKLQELRKVVKEQLKSLGVNDQIKSLVAETKGQPAKGKPTSITQQQAIDELKGRGVIDQLVKTLSRSELVEAGSSVARSHNKQHLHIGVKGVSWRVSMPSAADQVLLCGEVMGQRFRSAPVGAAAAQSMEAAIFVELPGPAPDPASLVTLRHPLHLVLLGTQSALSASTSGPPSTSASPQPSTSPINTAHAALANHAQGSVPSALGLAGATPSQAIPRNTHSNGALPGTLTMSAPHAAPAAFLATGSREKPVANSPHAIDSLTASRSTTLIGTGRTDWRTTLASKTPLRSVTVDMAADVGAGKQEVVATVKLELAMSPGLPHAVEGQVLQAQLDKERQLDAAAAAAFSRKAETWSSSLSTQASGPSTSSSAVLTLSEDGVQRPCCTHVRPLQLRLIATAREAARFVALLGSKASRANGIGCAMLHTIIVSRQASQEEKALLLASLLAGFGQDAWVARGTDAVGPCHWVLTRNGKEIVTFWDAVAGTSCNPSTAGQPKGCPYRSLSLIYNHRKVLANKTPAASVASMSYILEDTSQWQELAVTAQDVPGPLLPRFDLQMIPCDLASHEIRVEAELKKALHEYRQGAVGQVQTNWDDNIGFLLMSSLAAYEQEACGFLLKPTAADDFAQCIRRNIPSGCLFKGYPQHHKTLCSAHILKGMLKETPVQEILSTQAPDVSFALRVKVYQYPEHIFSVWLMLALKSPGPKRLARAQSVGQ